MLFDFHAHLTIKAFNSKSIYSEKLDLPDKDLWRERYRPGKNVSDLRKALGLAWEINTTSQIHLNSVQESGFRIICTSLYPLERVFTIALKDVKKSVLWNVISTIRDVRLVLGALEVLGPPAFRKLVATLTGFEVDRIKAVGDGDYHYYEVLKAEYDFLVANQNELPAYGKIEYELARNFADTQRITNEGKLAVIHTIEGCNAFLDLSGQFEHHLQNERQGQTQQIIEILKNNIKDFRDQAFPPFIITLAHHQYNFLCGHSPSFISLSKLFLKQEGETTREGTGEKIQFYDVGIRSWAFEIIELILEKRLGKVRTLIDTKHMSPAAREDYHEFVKNKRQQGDKIPIIQTHTGVNGRPKMGEARIANKSLELKAKDRNKSFFNTGSINLFDDEIADIVESGGMMGIMLDEKRIVGEMLPPDAMRFTRNLPFQDVKVEGSINTELKKAQLEFNKQPYQRYLYVKKEFKKCMFRLVRDRGKLEVEKLKDPDQQNQQRIKRIVKRISEREKEILILRAQLEPVALSILFNQFFHIVQMGGNKKSVWNHICIGTDYEGVIDPLDIYYYAGRLADFKERLVKFWKSQLNLSDDEPFKKYKLHLFDETPEFYIEKVLWGNSQWFLRKHFKEVTASDIA